MNYLNQFTLIKIIFKLFPSKIWGVNFPEDQVWKTNYLISEDSVFIDLIIYPTGFYNSLIGKQDSFKYFAHYP